MNISISSNKITQKTCELSHYMPVPYFFVTFCDMTLTMTLLGTTFALMQHLPWTYISTFGEIELFAVRETDPRFQNVKSLHSDL